MAHICNPSIGEPVKGHESVYQGSTSKLEKETNKKKNEPWSQLTISNSAEHRFASLYMGVSLSLHVIGKGR